MRLQVAITETNERLGISPSSPVTKYSVSQRFGVIPSSELENRTMQAKSLENYKIVSRNDLVLNRFNAYKGALGLAPGHGVVSPDYFVAKVNNEVADPQFIKYFLHAQPSAEVIKRDMGGMGSGDPDSSAFSRFDVRSLKSMEIPIDDLPTQRAIAGYLDRETVEIDDMRADLDDMEQLLEERCRNIAKSVFSNLRESGCNYQKLGYVAQFRNGQDTKGVEDMSGDYPVYGSGGVFKRANSFLFDGPSVLFGRKGTLDKPLLVNGKFWTVDTMYYTVLSRDVLPSFLHKWATTIPFEKYSTDTALPSMTSTILSQLRIPVPPLAKQCRIADEIDRETAEIDSMLEDIRELRDLLAERRTAVISAAVTGQIDIPASPTSKDESHA
ncbi:restriction endonuclease subunit S [Corynebacterium sp. MSK204]|uniref:restriction endonuclease subunit S n=1 Tax=Corynebacterium sp. MSK204 TaxID=3050217 RepID=UPI00254A1A18|nr:restriction endonuclease subunit S [Corynebacterium sp. MSK204]MDK8659160.1 restriction endonuclease subunit S [Corynebacterium sp. MSK204]